MTRSCAATGAVLHLHQARHVDDMLPVVAAAATDATDAVVCLCALRLLRQVAVTVVAAVQHQVRTPSQVRRYRAADADD